MTDGPEFLRRWSRRKRAAEKAADNDPAPEEDATDRKAGEQPTTAGTDATDQSELEAAGEEAVDLPDIDSLTADSDFSAFLKPGVPKELKNRALRKLWRVNPVFGQLDGLNDYDGDFTDAASVVKDLKTLYKVGRGFLPDPEDEVPSADAGETPAGETAGAAETTEEEPVPNSGDNGENGNKIS